MNRLRGERSDLEAHRTERRIEAFIAARGRRGTATADAATDPLASATARLAATLLPVHPSFRFEERLAARLGAAAAGVTLPAAVGAEGAPLAFLAGGPSIDDLLADVDEPMPASRSQRGLLIGGAAITSAALSLAGAAFVAWRRTRPPGHPMSPLARAARAAHRGRGSRRVPLARSID